MLNLQQNYPLGSTPKPKSGLKKCMSLFMLSLGGHQTSAKPIGLIWLKFAQTLYFRPEQTHKSYFEVFIKPNSILAKTVYFYNSVGVNLSNNKIK